MSHLSANLFSPGCFFFLFIWYLSCMAEVFLRCYVFLGCSYLYRDKKCGWQLGIYRWGLLSLRNTIQWCGWAFCWGTLHVSILRFSFFCWQDSPESTLPVSRMKGEDWLPAFLELHGGDGWACSQHSPLFRRVLFFECSTHALNCTSQPIVQRLSVLNSVFFLGVGRRWVAREKEDLFLNQLLLSPLYFSTTIQPQFQILLRIL